jgi:hypothetical protein
VNKDAVDSTSENIQFDVTVMTFERSENRIILPKLFFVEDDFFDLPKVD